MSREEILTLKRCEMVFCCVDLFDRIIKDVCDLCSVYLVDIGEDIWLVRFRDFV